MIAGKTISIGPLVPNDLASTFRWCHDTEAQRFNAAYRPIDWNTHKAWCERQDYTRVLFAIRRHGDAAIKGYVEIHAIHPVHRSAMIGIRIGEDRDRGQGMGREAMGLSLLYCWRHLNLNRVALSTFRHNERAQRAFRGAGFEPEGILRQAEYIDGEWIDVVMMAALRPTDEQLAALREELLIPQGERQGVAVVTRG